MPYPLVLMGFVSSGCKQDYLPLYDVEKHEDVVVVVVVLLFYVHGKHLRSCWDGQLT